MDDNIRAATIGNRRGRFVENNDYVAAGVVAGAPKGGDISVRYGGGIAPKADVAAECVR